MRRITLFALIAALALLTGNSAAFGQATASGTIQGTVLDKSQAAVGGAVVEATNKATGSVRSTASSDSGYYRFELLSAGVYTVKIAKAGFSSFEQTGELLVGQTLTINAELKVGASTEIIEVTSTAPIADIDKTDVGVNITPKDVQELPLLGRDVATLATLAPGVRATDSYDPTKNRYAVISINGQGGRNVNVTVNGVDNKDSTVGGTVMQLPLEAVAEFVISTQRFSAANGRSEGAAINMITKSGTNDYHGSLFGFFRDQALNAKNVFEGEKGPYSRQFFGGSFGAPIVKDKLFGFFALERQRESTSLAETPFAFDQLSLVTALGAEPASTIPTPFYEWRYNGRIDYRFNDRQTAYISYTSQSNEGQNDQSDGLGDLTGGNFTKNHLQLANFTLNSVFTPTLVNSFTFGYQFWNNIIDSNINAPYTTFAGGEWFGTNTNVPQESYQRKFQFRDDLTKTIRNHNLKFGVDYIYNPKFGGFFKSNSTLEIDFGGDPSDIIANTGGQYPNSFASPGAVTSMSISVGDPYFILSGKQLGLYLQDDWKITRRFTLNLGVRWDKDYNLIGASAIKNSRTFQELQAIGSPFSSSLPHDDNKDFSPRIGFAYDLTGSGKHVVRGGYGLYYGNVYENIPLFMIQQANPTIYQGVFSIASGDEVPGTGILLSDWRYGVDPMPTIPPPSSELNPGSTGRLMHPDYRNPVSEEFNVGYQWALTNNSVFEAEYVHTLGLHQNKTVNINPTDLNGVRPLSQAFSDAGVPVLGRISVEESIARSRYDGMNLSYRQRMTKHFSLNANYTLSRAVGWAIDSSGFRNYPHDPRNIWDPRDFGNTPNDERHHIALSGVVSLPWGFQVAPILQFGTARPFDLTSSYDPLGVGSGYARPAIVPTDDPTDYATYAHANKSTVNACLTDGSCHQAGYDTLRGDNFFQLDARVSKSIHLAERYNLQLMFQGFNLTNRANYGNNFVNSTGSGSFLQPAGFINPSTSSAVLPRAFVGEFGVRFTF